MIHISNKCKICNQDNFRLKYKIKKFDLLECKTCGFVQIAEIEQYDKYEYNNDYFTNSKYDNKASLNKENQRRKKLLLKYSKTGSKVIDVGCAAGEFVSFIKDSYDIYGCDFSESAIKLGKIKYPEIADKIWIGAAEDINAGNKKYDVICMWDVIEHIYEPKIAFLSLLELVNDGGYIIMSTPNISATFAKLCGKSWPFMTPPEHVGFFSKNSMQYMISSCGCKIIEWTSRGKWVNMGFVLYKINRVKSVLVPIKVINAFKSGILSKINIYVPTKDIQYVVIKKQ